MITAQAARVRDALKAIGLKHGRSRSGGHFFVRTEGSGCSPQGWGEAYAVLLGREAEDAAIANAQRLVDAGCSVMLMTLNGRRYASVTSHYPPRLIDKGEV
jgi:hypothetical protein